MIGTAGASLGKWARTIDANDSDPALTINQNGSGVGIQCKGDIIPSDDNTYDLGSAAKSFAEVHAQTAVYATSVVGNWSPSADDTYSLGLTSTKRWSAVYALVFDTGGSDDWAIKRNGVTFLSSSGAGRMVATKDLLFFDGKGLEIGSSADAHIVYVTADANAKSVHFGLPHVDEDGNNVACLVLMDRDFVGTDLGAGGVDLSGITSPTLAILAEDGAGYIAFSCTDGDIWRIKGTTSPVVEVDETKFSHKLELEINGATYYMMLTQT